MVGLLLYLLTFAASFAQTSFNLEQCFDFNLELESDPDELTTNLLAKQDYEEELMVADKVINDDTLQGYAFFHHEL